MLKSPTILDILLESFVLLSTSYKKISHGSVGPLGGPYKTLNNALHLLSNKISIESDSISLLLTLKPVLILKLKAS